MSLRTNLEAAAAAIVAFRNWPQVLAAIAAERAKLPAADLRAVTRRGSVIQCPNHPNARGVLWEIFCDDAYSLGSLVPALRDSNCLILDIGAHVGAFTVSLAERLPDAHFECYEPSSDTYEYLEKNVRSNYLSARVGRHNIAVGGATGQAAFWEQERGSSLSSRFPISGAKQTSVQVVSFDELIGGVQDEIGLVKIDCEGGEYDIVLGSSDRSWNRVRDVVIEHHPVRGYDSSQLMFVMARRGFRSVTLHENRPTHGIGLTWFHKGVQSFPSRIV